MKKYTWEEAVLWLRNNRSQQELVKACYYDDPIEAAAERYYQSEEWQSVQCLLKSKFPCRVLEIGAGRGISSYSFAKDNCEVFAFEPDNSNVVGSGCIRQINSRVGYSINIIESLDNLISENQKFDIIFCRAVLHHIPDLFVFFSNVKSLLNKDGVFLAVREHLLKEKKHLQTFLDNHPLHSLYGGENAFTLEEYLKYTHLVPFRRLTVYFNYEKAFNYYPDSKSQVLDKLQDWVNKKSFLYRIMHFFPFFRRKLLRKMSDDLYFPGIHIGFLASK